MMDAIVALVLFFSTPIDCSIGQSARLTCEDGNCGWWCALPVGSSEDPPRYHFENDVPIKLTLGARSIDWEFNDMCINLMKTHGAPQSGKPWEAIYFRIGKTHYKAVRL